MTLDQIRTKIYLLTSTNVSSLPDATLVPLVNNAFDRVTSLIMGSDGRWQWDDTNNTDIPIGTTDLVTSQQDYSIDITHLEITRVELKDSNGNWNKLDPIDEQDIYNQSLTDFLKTANVPIYYDKIGNSIFLYPTPNYSQSASLKVYFERGPNYFVTSDTTKAPGFNALFHDLLAYWPAYDFAISTGKANANNIMSAITEKEDALAQFYALRAKDDHPRVRVRPFSFR